MITKYFHEIYLPAREHTRLIGSGGPVGRALHRVPGRGGRQIKDCSQTWFFGFHFCLGKHLSDERGLAFYYLKIGYLEYLHISGETRDTVSKCTHWLLKEGDNLERSLYCACGSSYPRLSGGASELINKVLMMERLPRQLKGGPEPLENEINKILGSKCEDLFSDHFSNLVQNICSVRFSYLIFCQAPGLRDMRKFPQKCQKMAGCGESAVYGSRPLIDLKPDSSPLERPI